jgi:hypothetical protein
MKRLIALPLAERDQDNEIDKMNVGDFLPNYAGPSKE